MATSKHIWDRVWILYYIPKPSLQISHREMYYEIVGDDYIEVKEY